MVRKEFITTTGNFEGYKIDKYLGIVDERIVVGAGFLSDLFASFTDTVGGRSDKYEQRIKELYDALIYGIQKQANRKGANAIIGFKIDVDEISGKGMSMFMATAVGTAVYINKDKSDEQETLQKNTIHSNEIKKIILSEKYSEKIKNIEVAFKDKIQVIEELYEQYITIPLDILVNFIFETDFKNDTTTAEIREIQFNIVLNYFNLYDDYEIAKELNKKLKIITNDDKKLFFYIYQNTFNVYYEDILPLIEVIRIDILQKTAFKTLLKYKDIYSDKDIEIIDKIINKLKMIINTETQNINNAESWICPFCTQKNSGKAIKCKVCERGKYQMAENVITHLSKINNILKTNSANKQ